MKGVRGLSGCPTNVRLKELHLELPLPPQPLATYVPAVQAGDLLFLSGVLPMRDGQLAFSGESLDEI